MQDETKQDETKNEGHSIEEAAKQLGILPRTLVKWFRNYDIVGHVGQVPDRVSDYEISWIKERLKEMTIGESRFRTLDSTKVKRVHNKVGEPIVRVPDLGNWTPKKSEINTYMRRFPKSLRTEALSLIEQGFLPAAILARHLGWGESHLRLLITRANVKPHAVLGSRFAFYNPQDVEPLRHSSERTRPTVYGRQLDLFRNRSSELAQAVNEAKSVLSQGNGLVSKLDAPLTPEEVERSLSKVPDKHKAAVAVLVKSGMYMTANVAAARLGVHCSTVRHWAKISDPDRKEVLAFGQIKLHPVETLKKFESEMRSMAVKADNKREARSEFTMTDLAKAEANILLGQDTVKDRKMIKCYRAALRAALGLPRVK